MKTDFSMRPVIGGLLCGNYTVTSPRLSRFFGGTNPPLPAGEGRVRVFPNTTMKIWDADSVVNSSDFGGDTEIQKVPELIQGFFDFRFRLSLVRAHPHTFR